MKILWIGPHRAFARRYLAGPDVELSFLDAGTDALHFVNQEVENELDIIVYDREGEDLEALLAFRTRMLSNPCLRHIPFVLVSSRPSPHWRRVASKLRVADYLEGAIDGPSFRDRISRLLIRSNEQSARDLSMVMSFFKWGIPLWKRTFDIIGSLALILLLSPLFILVALLVKLESRGPVFYISKRVGQGFRQFDFYKFRSMRVGASKEVKAMKKVNQYGGEIILPEEKRTASQAQLLQDNGFIEESGYRQQKALAEGRTFFKVKDDPRITRVGRIIRSTSIDELPQLFNVLKGDMSLVGNRPLPLYEAEKLTADEWILRFKAPAGITGLWQVKGRGKADVSEEERKRFDIEYAQKYNLRMDLMILWKTLPAAVQEVNV